MTAREIHARVSERETAEVMGLRLVPLTVGHARLMDHLGCAVLRDAGDVALAVLICSRPHERVIGFLRSWLMPVWLWLWKRYLGAWDAQGEADALDAYLRRHTELPMMVPAPGEDGGPSNVPAHQMLRSILMSRLGYRPSEIDGTPYLQALWDVAALGVREGRFTMLDTTAAAVEEAEQEIDWDAIDARAVEIRKREVEASR